MPEVLCPTILSLPDGRIIMDVVSALDPNSETPKTVRKLVLPLALMPEPGQETTTTTSGLTVLARSVDPLGIIGPTPILYASLDKIPKGFHGKKATNDPNINPASFGVNVGVPPPKASPESMAPPESDLSTNPNLEDAVLFLQGIKDVAINSILRILQVAREASARFTDKKITHHSIIKRGLFDSSVTNAIPFDTDLKQWLITAINTIESGGFPLVDKAEGGPVSIRDLYQPNVIPKRNKFLKKPDGSTKVVYS